MNQIFSLQIQSSSINQAAKNKSSLKIQWCTANAVWFFITHAIIFLMLDCFRLSFLEDLFDFSREQCSDAHIIKIKKIELINSLNFSWLSDYEIITLSSVWSVDLFILKFVKFCCFLTVSSIILMFIIISYLYDEKSTCSISLQFSKLHLFFHSAAISNIVIFLTLTINIVFSSEHSARIMTRTWV